MVEKHFSYASPSELLFAIAKYQVLGKDKAVFVTIYQPNGETRNEILFHCNPNFKGYEKYNAMTSEELIATAIKRLKSSKFSRPVDNYAGKKICVLFRFNT